MKERRNKNETLSLLKMVQEKTDEPEEVLQKVLLHPKGVMLWSKRSVNVRFRQPITLKYQTKKDKNTVVKVITCKESSKICTITHLLPL